MVVQVDQHGLARRATGARVVQIPPNKQWVGNDGPWSSFLVGVGTPPQYSQVLISTTANQPWMVVPQGCPAASANSSGLQSCALDRGGVYDPLKSTTWAPKGNYTLHPEGRLDETIRGQYGFESLDLGPQPNGTDLSIAKQLIAGIADEKFHIATWGVHPLATNLTTLSDPIPSWVESLKSLSHITSLSWAYTAGSYGAFQIEKQALGSLTLGGYDASLYIPHNTTFNLAASDDTDLLVGLQSIAVSGGGKSLLPKPIIAFLDSGVPHLWLPEEACQAFQNAFSLTYNSTLDLYLVNETAHTTLVKQNASIDFTLSNDLGAASPSVTVSLPYAAFDLNLTSSYPGVDASTRYFPIRRAANSTQYTLGRTFFQHAYVIADYERRTYSVHQALFPDSPSPDLHEITPPSDASGSSSGSSTALPVGGIVGIVVGIVALIAIVLASFLVLRRRRARRNQPPAIPPKGHLVSELGLDEKPLSPELAGDLTNSELEGGKGSAALRSEMAGGGGGRLKAELASAGAESRPELADGSMGRMCEMEGPDSAAAEMAGSGSTAGLVELDGGNWSPAELQGSERGSGAGTLAGDKSSGSERHNR